MLPLNFVLHKMANSTSGTLSNLLSQLAVLILAECIYGPW